MRFWNYVNCIFLLWSLAGTATAQSSRIGDVATVPNGVTPPLVMQYGPPQYTESALQNRIEGTVTVEAEFDIYGNFKVLRLVRSLGFGLDESALIALQNWRFAPAIS